MGDYSIPLLSWLYVHPSHKFLPNDYIQIRPDNDTRGKHRLCNTEFYFNLSHNHNNNVSGQHHCWVSTAADSVHIHSSGHNSIPPPPHLVYFSPPLSSVSFLLLLAFLPLDRLFCGLRDGLGQSQRMPSRLDMLEKLVPRIENLPAGVARLRGTLQRKKKGFKSKLILQCTVVPQI